MTNERDRPADESIDGIGATPAMIEAGIIALARLCRLDLAFPVGGEEDAVEEVWLAMCSERQRALRRTSEVPSGTESTG